MVRVGHSRGTGRAVARNNPTTISTAHDRVPAA